MHDEPAKLRGGDDVAAPLIDAPIFVQRVKRSLSELADTAPLPVEAYGAAKRQKRGKKKSSRDASADHDLPVECAPQTVLKDDQYTISKNVKINKRM